MDSREVAILKTLLYSSLFDYPLREAEIYNFLIGIKMEENELLKSLKNVKIPIDSSDGLVFLKGSKRLVKIRQAREATSLIKLKKAEGIINKLSLIPTIKLIGISGTLAMKNCDEDDDIDIFVISQKGFAWTTRFLTAVFLIVLGVYRNKHTKHYQDKICLNLILDEDRMLFTKQDLFTAHEIVQLLPVFERDAIYEKFIHTNQWLRKFLPNFQIKIKPVFRKRQNYFGRAFIFLCQGIFLEKILKKLQLVYMEKAITKERLEDGFIGLHPFDYKSYILKKYKQKLGKSGLKDDTTRGH